MTCIAVRKYKKHIEISCDSMISYWWYWQLLNSSKKIIKDYCKLFQVNWITSWWAWYLEHLLQLKEFIKTNLPKWSRLDDIESFFLEFYKEQKDKWAEFSPDKSTYIFIFDKKMFLIDWFMIYEIEEYEAVGSGMMIALTAMYLWKDTEESIKIASEFAPYVGGEITTFKINL